MMMSIACFIMLCAVMPLVVVLALWATVELYAWVFGKK